MAKKAVASLQTNTKKRVKLIRCKKNKSGAYSFKAEFMSAEEAEQLLNPGVENEKI
jgi:hypothetical protein